MSTILNQLFENYHVEGLEMPYTMNDFRREYIHEHAEEILEQFSAEERLQSLSLEERLQSLSLEERLQSLSLEDRLHGLSLEELASSLSQLEQQQGQKKDHKG